MEKEDIFDIVFVSLGGRGNWLASEMVRLGHKVVLVDLGMGLWAPEDIEGPFGYFRTDRLKPSQVERLVEGDQPMNVANGFSIWLKSGPLEMQGPLTQYRLNALGLPKVCLDYLYSTQGDQTKTNLLQSMAGLDIEKTWLASFAHQFSSAEYFHQEEALTNGIPLPLFASYFVKMPSRLGLERTYEWLQGQGVEVFKDAKLRDISIEKSIEGIEILSERYSGILKAKDFVFHLTSSEAQHFGLANKLFGKAVLQPEWAWMRLRIRMDSCYERENLPLQTVILEDLRVPWVHENMLVLLRTLSKSDFDLWMKLPENQRFQRSYVETRGLRAMDVLARRMPNANPQIIAYPQESLYNSEDLGPSCYPIYRAGSRKLKVRGDNVIVDSPETWPGLDRYSQLMHQTQVVEQLKQMREKRLKKEKIKND